MRQNLLKKLNLNSYEWWRNHRRLISAALLIALFGAYVRKPSENDFSVRDICAKLNSNYQITGRLALEKLNLKSQKGFSDREIANYYCERYLGIN